MSSLIYSVSLDASNTSLVLLMLFIEPQLPSSPIHCEAIALTTHHPDGLWPSSRRKNPPYRPSTQNNRAQSANSDRTENIREGRILSPGSIQGDCLGKEGDQKDLR